MGFFKKRGEGGVTNIALPVRHILFHILAGEKKSRSILRVGQFCQRPVPEALSAALARPLVPPAAEPRFEPGRPRRSVAPEISCNLLVKSGDTDENENEEEEK